jgi:hypothetical protein
MKHFVFQILDVASALGKSASSAHPAGALAHLGEPHPDRTRSDPRPARWTRARRPSTTPPPPAAPAAPAPPEPGRAEAPVRALDASRWTAGVVATTAAVLVAMTLSAPPAPAREALPDREAVSARDVVLARGLPSAMSVSAAALTPWYATPVSSIRTLAQYVADHGARVLGAVAG